MRKFLALTLITIVYSLVVSCANSRMLACPEYENDAKFKARTTSTYKPHKYEAKSVPRRLKSKHIKSTNSVFSQQKPKENQNYLTSDDSFLSTDSLTSRKIIDINAILSQEISPDELEKYELLAYNNTGRNSQVEGNSLLNTRDDNLVYKGAGKPNIQVQEVIDNKTPIRQRLVKKAQESPKDIQVGADPAHKFAKRSLIFGLLGISAFIIGPFIPIAAYLAPLGILAIIAGSRSRRFATDQTPKQTLRMSRAGITLGIISTILMVLGILVIILIVLAFAGAFA